MNTETTANSVKARHSSAVVLVPPEYDLGGAEVVERFQKAFANVGRVVVPR